ncbi:Rne/Rng family ribonuclease [Roseospira goensis]|uniref:Ribonuclease E n=1 Tax=Roseospira goensis TaxID=391922 RepID=A0A7W6WIQ5_9PROT|nr:Rne/Rng family ribonuclease [Roseospira goensis]MBB4284476.1 ribonuclease E [Roseospira goensis]
MTKRLLIDTGHPEETRVVVLDGTRLEEFDVETSTKKQIKGNIYLAKVVRVEPSLQAAFVEYGGNRHGFLAFSEIHPDYYQIPVADRQALIAEQTERQRAAEAEEESRAERGAGRGNGNGNNGNGDSGSGAGRDSEDVEELGGEETVAAASPQLQANMLRHYKIQEVIKRRQILLVQVVKEERGNKGAALTTYLSLAGRYCVFMPNTARGGGVSRKISSQADRRRLKGILADLHGPPGGSVILRTAGAERSKAEIKRDFEFLMRQWEQIKDTTLKSIAPALIHEEANLIKRAIRDIYTRDVEEVIVDGEDGYRAAKDFMKMLTPSHARKVKPYRDQTMPLFHRFQVESQLDAMHSPVAQLRSGGYVVINQTEALVAIDVNSGRATKERHIEETALKTNLEAADEIARQLRLRDLAGLIVIDFIDMDDNRNNAAVERRLKEALKQDRARIQMGRISAFGLMELSRQRLRPSLMETAFHTCQHCHGTGVVRSIESTAIQMLRVLEEEGVRRRSAEVTLRVPTPVALYILNNKRAMLTAIEARYEFRVSIEGDDSLIIPAYTMDRVRAESRPGAEATAPEREPVATEEPPEAYDNDNDDDGEDDDLPDRADQREAARDGDDASTRKKRRRRRRKPKRDDAGERSGDEARDERDDREERDEGDDGEGRDERDQRDQHQDDDASADDDAGNGDGNGDGDGDANGNGDDDGGNGGSSRSRRSRRRRGGRRNRRSSGTEAEDGADGAGSGEAAPAPDTAAPVTESDGESVNATDAEAAVLALAAPDERLALAPPVETEAETETEAKTETAPAPVTPVPFGPAAGEPEPASEPGIAAEAPASPADAAGEEAADQGAEATEAPAEAAETAPEESPEEAPAEAPAAAPDETPEAAPEPAPTEAPTEAPTDGQPEGTDAAQAANGEPGGRRGWWRR